MEELIICALCNKTFGSKEGLESHNFAKHPEQSQKLKKPFPVKKTKNLVIFLIILAVIVFGIYFVISNLKILPPTDMQGHIEENPPSHIMKEPMNLLIQKHMLEHADGVCRPGAVINYNCEDFMCEEGLIENLEAFTNTYDYVYVAPFKNMDAKIALTKLGEIEVLEEYDKERIEDFIR